jgi:hypothetical protein
MSEVKGMSGIFRVGYGFVAGDRINLITTVHCDNRSRANESKK